MHNGFILFFVSVCSVLEMMTRPVKKPVTSAFRAVICELCCGVELRPGTVFRK